MLQQRQVHLGRFYALVTSRVNKKIAISPFTVAVKCRFVYLQQRDSECGFIAIVLKTLVTQVKCELKDIQQLETLRLEYLGLQMQLGHWLTDCPSVADLKAGRQTIKALKSRLRHTLADKQDAEEVRVGEG